MSLDKPNVAIERSVTAVDQRWRERFAIAIADVKLRQWCVEEAGKAAHDGRRVVELARVIHGFVTAGLVEAMEEDVPQ